MNRQQLIDALHKSIDPVAQQAADFLESTTTDCHACALADEMIAARDARIAELEQQLSGKSGEFAAHETKRTSCSKTAKKSTREGGRVDETGKSEQVGGAA